MNSSLITQLIKEHTKETEVDIKAIAQNLGLKVVLNTLLDDYCRISYLGEDASPTIELNNSLDVKSKFTLVAIAIADYILSPERVRDKGISYDMFFLKTMSEQKYSYRMLLATRLAFPEKIMAMIDTDPTAFSEFLSSCKYLPEFVRLCSPDKSLSFVLSNFGD